MKVSDLTKFQQYVVETLRRHAQSMKVANEQALEFLSEGKYEQAQVHVQAATKYSQLRLSLINGVFEYLTASDVVAILTVENYCNEWILGETEIRLFADKYKYSNYGITVEERAKLVAISLLFTSCKIK